MKPVKGFEDYKVTKDGEVFDKNGRKLTVGRDNQGYATVTLRKDGKSYSRRLHRVVGETYLKPIEGKNIINHKDGDKSHCRLVNLEYMSNSENTKHGYDNGFYRSRSNLPVIVIDKDGKEAEFTSIRGLSRELGLNRKTVSSILNSGRNNNYDYTFKYKELEKKGAETMKYAEMLDELYKKANEDDDGVQVCNNCGKPMSIKGEPGSCTCEGGKGTSSKKEFLENELAKKLASERLEELYLDKIAANTDLGPVDWGKQKTILLNPSEYKVRDAKLGEAIRHNAKQGAKAGAKAGVKGAKAGVKGAKAGIKGAKNYAKLVKQAPMAGVLPAAAGLVVANNVHQYKKREKSRDNDIKTDAMKDKVIPENIRAMKTMPLGMAGGLAGATVGPKAGMKVGGRLANKVALKAGLKGTKALKALKAGAVTGAVAGMVTPVIGAGVASNELKKRDALKKLDKLSNKYLGRPATEAEKKVIRDRNRLTTPAHKRGGVTPESEVQKRRRALAKAKKQEKKAFEFDEPKTVEELLDYPSIIYPEIKSGKVVKDGSTYKLASEILEALYMEKQAGITSTLMSGLGGLAIGVPVGNKVGGIRNKLTFDKERKSLVKQVKESKEEFNNVLNDVINYEDLIHEELGKKYKAHIMNMTPEQRKKLTVGDVESFLSKNVPDFKKEASAEGIAFGAGAGLGAWSGYKYKADKGIMKDTIKRVQDSTNYHKVSLTPEGKDSLRGSFIDYTPGFRDSFDPDEVKEYKRVLDNELSKQGVNVNKMNLREYKSLLKGMLNRAEQDSLAEPIDLAKKSIDKHMTRVASTIDMINDLCMDNQEKQASEKWTKQDKKGFIRNMAINTAQDFVNAGNPLNVGSHIVGSVMDSALMEGMTMKMNKKLQAQKINEKKLKQFNDAKGLSNGTTAVKAVKSTPRAVKKITSNNNN